MFNRPKIHHEVQDAFYVFISNNMDRFYRLALSYVKNTEDASDIVQESVYKALTKIHTLKTVEFLSTWFYRILVNTSLDFLRKNKKSLLTQEKLIQHYEIMKFTESEIDLHNAIDQLDSKMKSVIILRYFHDMKLQDIASILDCNENTVKSRLYKALKILKINLEEQYEE